MLDDAQLISRLELLAELVDVDEEHSITQSAIVTPYKTNEACIDYFGLPSPHTLPEASVAGPRAKTPDYLSQGFGAERPSSAQSWHSETYLAPVKSGNGSEKQSDDAGSIAETLSEWGLDKVGDEHSTPKRPSKSRTSLEDEESGLAYLHDEATDVLRPASSLSHRAGPYTRSRTTSAMSAYSTTSRPGSALSRFDPGRIETPEEKAERLEAEADRPVFSSPYTGRPKVLVMPSPLFEEGQAQDAAKRMSKVVRKSPSNESLQVRERPAGKLYGLSLLDRLEQRKAEIKGRRRVFSGDNRIKMSNTHYDLSAPDTTPAPADDSEPFLRFATNKAAAESSNRPVTGIFGRDMVLEKELEKLAKIRLVEEAQRKMDLERKRVDDAVKAERDAKKKQKADRKGKKRETMPTPEYDLPPSPLRQELSIEPEPPIPNEALEVDPATHPSWLPPGAPSLPPGSSYPESPAKSQYSDRYLSPPGTPSRHISVSLDDFDPNFDPSFSPTSPSKQNPWAMEGEGSPDKPFRASYASRSDELRQLWTTTSSDSESDAGTDEQEAEQGAVLADVLADREEAQKESRTEQIEKEEDDLPISSVVRARKSQVMLEGRKAKISFEPAEEGDFNLDAYLGPEATKEEASSDSDASEHVPLGNRLSGTMWSNPSSKQQQPIPSINEQLDSDDEKPLASRKQEIDSDDEKPLAAKRKSALGVDDDEKPLRPNSNATDNVPLGYARQSFVAQQQQQQWMNMQMQMQAMQYQQHMMAVAYQQQQQQQQMAQQYSMQAPASEMLGPGVVPPAKLVDSVDAWRKDVDPSERQ